MQKYLLLFIVGASMLLISSCTKNSIRPATPDLALQEINAGQVKLISEAKRTLLVNGIEYYCILHPDIEFSREGRVAEHYYMNTIRDSLKRIVSLETKGTLSRDTFIYSNDEFRPTIYNEGNRELTHFLHEATDNSTSEKFSYFARNNDSLLTELEAWHTIYQYVEYDTCGNWTKRKAYEYITTVYPNNVGLQKDYSGLFDINLPLNIRSIMENELAVEFELLFEQGKIDKEKVFIETRKIEYYQ